MTFTLRQGAFSTSTTGTTISTTIGSTPNVGQLLIAAARTPAPVTTLTNVGYTAPSGFSFIPSTPIQIGASGVMWATLLYKVAGASEPTSITLAWPLGTAAAAAPGQATLEYDEFNGFTGTPTLDILTSATSSSNDVSTGSINFPSNPTAVHELALCYAATGNTSGAWKPINSTYGQGITATVLAFTNGNASSYSNVGWCDNTNDFRTGGVPNIGDTWTTSRAWAGIGATFKDVSSTVGPFVGHIGHA